MGISGLLPFLEQATKPCHISEFRGATCVVDAYCWLHKGANACAIQLAQGNDTQVYVHYCMKYIKMLQHYNIRPILVFDGKNLPAKAGTEAKRRESRNKAKQRAAELLRLGKTEEAQSYLKQSVNVTPEMASAVIRECHKINIDCIVAPYESDAQLAFFSLKGVAEIVITEDSDLLLFGCSKVMFKLDLQGGGYVVDAGKIPDVMKLRPDRYTFDKFRYMCIISGCDYIESLKGIGLKKAHKFISLTEETNPEIFLDKLPRYLNMRHLQITDEYKENFMVADATFKHQIVFDPFKKKAVPLTDPDVCGTNPKYCKNAGQILDDERAYQVALGNLHPTTFKQLDNWSPDMMATSSNSIWSGIYQKTLSRKEQKTKFKEFFKSTSKIEKKEVVVDERVKIEEDLEITRTLDFYSCKKTDFQEVNVSVEVKEDIEELPRPESTSPVLQRNPFLKKKKLSKFHLTELDNKVIVKSRYFSSDKTEEETLSKKELSLEVACSESDTMDIENTPSNRNCNIQGNTLDIEENKCSLGSDDIAPSIDNIIDLSIDEPDEYEDKVVVIEEKMEECAVSSQQKNVENTCLKRKLLGPCRSIGLKRSKSAGQQTIQHFFGKMRKD